MHKAEIILDEAAASKTKCPTTKFCEPRLYTQRMDHFTHYVSNTTR